MEVEATAGVELTPEQTLERARKAVAAWQSSVKPFQEWKAFEAAKRLEAAQLCFPNPVKSTQRFDLGGGYKLKLVYGLTYTLGDKDLVDPILNEKVLIETQVRGTLEAIEALGPVGELLANRLIKFKPELSEAEYKALSSEGATEIHAEAKKLIDTILIIKPASPQLTYEEPKAVT